LVRRERLDKTGFRIDFTLLHEVAGGLNAHRVGGVGFENPALSGLVLVVPQKCRAVISGGKTEPSSG
jgi:hypothetical protein